MKTTIIFYVLKLLLMIATWVVAYWTAKESLALRKVTREHLQYSGLKKTNDDSPIKHLLNQEEVQRIERLERIASKELNRLNKDVPYWGNLFRWTGLTLSGWLILEQVVKTAKLFM
jgi:hypothetical protein